MPYSAARVTLIAAVDRNLAIGKGGKLLWPNKLRADMDHFRDTTMGHPVVLGRPSYMDIPLRYRPLQGRENWILTRNPHFSELGCRIFHDVESVLLWGIEREIFIAGGGEVYKLFLPYATRMILTHVEARFEDADAFFPKWTVDDWNLNILMEHDVDEKNHFAFTIKEYRRPDEF